MSSNKQIRIGPVAVPASVGNLINPPTLTGGVNPPAGSTNSHLILRHIRIVNKNASARTFSGYIGATGGSAAGTEFLGTGLSIPGNTAYDWYGAVRLEPADFFTGVSSTDATSLVITAEGEIGVN